MAVALTIDELELTGGDPALDFVNTVETRASDPLELLRSYRDLVDWTLKVGLIDGRTARSLARAAWRWGVADEALARAIALREAAYEVLVAYAVEHRAPPKAALAVISAEIADASGSASLEFDGETFNLRPPSRDAFLPLHLVAQALADLLTGPRLQRVGRCDGVGDCGWLFLDTTKNGSRRWCSMAGCGSRAKMRRYYARTRNA
jgi:predicted RNA-binding Zn ribbon-like protein